MDLDFMPPPAAKDTESQQPIESVEWQHVIERLVDAFIDGDYQYLNRPPCVNEITRDTAKQIEEYVADYGCRLAALPQEVWQTSVSMWMGKHWELLIDLWTEEEGASDLALVCWIHDSPKGCTMEVISVHVP